MTQISDMLVQLNTSQVKVEGQKRKRRAQQLPTTAEKQT